MDIDNEIALALKSDIEDYMISLKKNKLMKKVIEVNDLCNDENDIEFFYVMFLKGTLELKNGVCKLYNRINNKINNPKKTNKFIYQFLKLQYKSANNMWSWNEIETFDIDSWDRTIKFTNYEL